MLTTKNQIQYLNSSLEFEVSRKPAKIDIIGSPVTALPFEVQINIILEWAMNKVSKVICVSNTHMLVEAYWHPEFSSVLKSADIVTPDGMPLVWMLKLMGI
ncbi:glycosyltransferase, partial [Dolichospermum planctonicum UHCC 0167]|uniref:WecB/TagA/CpsF family glycosyltransferase n=1 Tax=Dolichospermum planctonicum TaxID=136072 RepID=UPI00396A4B45|nr:glycosyltransferase [Dolichospermum planctonicum UHCC 0167]